MVSRRIDSAFGCIFVENNWCDNDWDNYQFNIKLMISIKDKALMERRNINKDERKFISELEKKNQSIREVYGVA